MKFGTLVRLKSTDEADIKFKALKDNGFESCQLVYKPSVFTAEEGEIIKSSAEKFGIEISAQFVGYNDSLCSCDMKFDRLNAGINSPFFGGERIKYVLSAIPFVKALGVTDMIIHAGYIPADAYSDAYIRMVSAVGLIARKLKEEGLNLLFETGQEAPITLVRIINEVGTGNIFINLDTANLIMYGLGNPVDALYTFGKYVRNCHFKDGLPPTNPDEIGKEVILGEGYVDFVKVIKLLKELNYDRFITIENELASNGHNEMILNAREYIKKLWY